jgi:lipoprotein-releasing system permease protein
MRAPQVAQRLAQRLPYLGVSDWTRQHVNFFRAVRTEKTVMFIILSLIVGVAAFNIISTLVMMVADKRADIAILRTMGATPGSVMGVFVVQGAVIGVVGTLLGVVGGVALSLNVETLVPWLERTLHVSLWPSDVYYISSLPSQLNVRDVANITGLALSLSLLATLYPAWRAARTDPAEALRYE